VVSIDLFGLMDDCGPEKVVCVSDRRTGMKGVLVIDNTARELLHERGIEVVPDFIANAGGVIAAAHSMDAHHSPFPVDPAGVFPSPGSGARWRCVGS
jgi:hypothetical protein